MPRPKNKQHKHTTKGSWLPLTTHSQMAILYVVVNACKTLISIYTTKQPNLPVQEHYISFSFRKKLLNKTRCEVDTPTITPTYPRGTPPSRKGFDGLPPPETRTIRPPGLTQGRGKRTIEIHYLAVISLVWAPLP